MACPLLVLLLQNNAFAAALCLFIAAGITDGLDGYIAKKFNCVSGLGAILDPMADKLLVACAYIMLTILGELPFWLLIAVMFRDLIIVAGYLILVGMSVDIPVRPIYLSKLNTFLQISLVILVLLGKSASLQFPLFWLISEAMIYGVLFTTLGSGFQYVWAWGIRRA